jgi:hypothetical protein
LRDWTWFYVFRGVEEKRDRQTVRDGERDRNRDTEKDREMLQCADDQDHDDDDNEWWQ